MNYYELIYLKKELKNKFSDCVVSQIITPFKNLLELFIEGREESFRLIFSSAPGNIALFADSDRGAKKSNTIKFFQEIYRVPIQDIEVSKNDRIVTIQFENGFELWFKLFSNQANAFLVKDNKIQQTFKDHDAIGDQAPIAKELEFFKSLDASITPKQILLQANPLLPRANLKELIKLNDLEGKDAPTVLEFAKLITEKLEKEPALRLLDNGEVTLLDESILPISTREMFSSVNDLILYRFKNYSHNQRLKQAKGEYSKILKRQLKRLDSSLRNLEQADKGIEKSELYEKYGHLLMANAHLGQPSTDTISVSDLYRQGEEIEIKVDPNVSLAESAEKYYKRSSSSLKSYQQALDRIPVIEARRKRLETMRDQIDEIRHLRDIEEWKKKFKKELEALGIAKKSNNEPNLPFHKYEVNGYQIWIGKNAKSNDKLVQLSHKEDVWMHARGVPGSHLVIRMKNNKGMPEKYIIEEAASYAAFNSKAKGSALVPVIFTKRKFVRKPKGTAPGAVIVQKEEVELVKPKNPNA